LPPVVLQKATRPNSFQPVADVARCIDDRGEFDVGRGIEIEDQSAWDIGRAGRANSRMKFQRADLGDRRQPFHSVRSARIGLLVAVTLTGSNRFDMPGMAWR